MLIRGCAANSAFGYTAQAVNSGCREKLSGKLLMQQKASRNSLQMVTLFCPRLQCSTPPESEFWKVFCRDPSPAQPCTCTHWALDFTSALQSDRQTPCYMPQWDISDPCSEAARTALCLWYIKYKNSHAFLPGQPTPSRTAETWILLQSGKQWLRDEAPDIIASPFCQAQRYKDTEIQGRNRSRSPVFYLRKREERNSCLSTWRMPQDAEALGFESHHHILLDVHLQHSLFSFSFPRLLSHFRNGMNHSC